jgi:hypothetical protein
MTGTIHARGSPDTTPAPRRATTEANPGPAKALLGMACRPGPADAVALPPLLGKTRPEASETSASRSG